MKVKVKEKIKLNNIVSEGIGIVVVSFLRNCFQVNFWAIDKSKTIFNVNAVFVLFMFLRAHHVGDKVS